MRRRQRPEQAPSFRPSDVFRLALLGLDRYRAEFGEPSPELLAALDEHRDRQGQRRPHMRLVEPER